MCASCDSIKLSHRAHCDVSQKNNHINITPFIKNCHINFCYYEDGRLGANQELGTDKQNDAIETINILNLNCNDLVNRRKKIISEFNSYDIDDMKRILQKEDGKFLPFFYIPFLSKERYHYLDEIL